MGSNIDIAIKQAPHSKEYGEFKDFKDEFSLLESLEPHLNLVGMIGSCETGLNQYNKRTWLLLEFCQHGDMKTYLVKNKAKILDTSNEDVFN